MNNIRVAKELLKLARELTAGAYREKESLDDTRQNMEDESVRVLDVVLNLSPSARVVQKEFLVFSEGTSHKFHFFALYNDAGVMKAGNAYGRIGGRVTAIEIGRGSGAADEFNRKLRSKINKGYHRT